MEDGIKSLIGSGDLYIDRLNADGTRNGYALVGNATQLELNVETEQKELKSKGRDTYGQTLASVSHITDSTVALTLNQVDKDTLAAVFMGDAVLRTGAGGSITSEAVTAKSGKWVELVYKDVSNVVIQDETDTTTYVEGTDYNVNPRLGLIEILAAGSITDDETLHVAYDWEAETGYKITGATQPTVRMALRLDGKNDYDGSDIDVNVFEALLTPASAVDWLSDEWNEISFNGKMITPTGKSWPFEAI